MPSLQRNLGGSTRLTDISCHLAIILRSLQARRQLLLNICYPLSSTCFRPHRPIIRRSKLYMQPMVFSPSADVFVVRPLRKDNKTCRIKHVTPRYINIKVSGDNKRDQNTKNAAIRHRISQEFKFQYAKKQQLIEQLYKTHLECRTQWTTIWQMIQ